MEAEQYRGLADFRLALRRLTAAGEAINRAAGITQQQYQALLAIGAWPYQVMAIKDLAEQLLLTHHAAVQMVDRLSKAGLVTRRPSEADRRSVTLALTPRGGALLDELAARHLEEVLRQEPSLTSSLRRLKRLAPPR